MKKVIGTAMMLLLCVIGMCAVNTESKAVEWNTTATEKVKKGVFTFSAHFSSDNTECWIYHVKVAENGSNKKLKFPKKIKGAVVTKLGGVPDTSEDAEFDDNIFGVTIEQAHDLDGYGPGMAGIKKMILPDTVTEVTYGAFSGLNDLKSVELPNKIEELPYALFYGCDNLKEVKLPKKLKTFNKYSFDDCPKLEKITISKKNKNYKVYDSAVLTKDGKKMLWIPPMKKKVTVPASVEEFETWLFNNTDVKDIKIAKKNKTLARSGQSIYTKKEKRLVAVIAKKRKVKISSKVKELGNNISVANAVCDALQEASLDRVDIPKSVNKVIENWMFFDITCKVYFHSKKPPVIESQYDGNVFTAMPIFNEIYVPKGAKKAYIKWANDRDGLEFDRLHTF